MINVSQETLEYWSWRRVTYRIILHSISFLQGIVEAGSKDIMAVLYFVILFACLLLAF